MMNRREEVLAIFMEECGEAIQAAAKIIRFGVTDEKKEQLEHELGDILAMMRLVDEEVDLNQDRMLEFAEKKLIKVEQYMTNKRAD